MITLPIPKTFEGQRVDKFIRSSLPYASLSFIYKALRQGTFKINGKKSALDYRLKAKDALTLHISEEAYHTFVNPLPSEKRARTFTVLYEDEDLLLVNKPAFLASQPGKGVEYNNLIDQVKDYFQGSMFRPALANRLDRETSGIVVLGKHKQAVVALANLLEQHALEKEYLALVHGTFEKKQGVLRCYLKRVKEHFQHKMQVVSSHEKGAVLAEADYAVLQQTQTFSLLTLRLVTGKMHQLRVQLASIGHPLVGDKVYADKTTLQTYPLKRHFLHAFRVSFIHPFTKKPLNVQAPLPSDLRDALKDMHFALPQEVSA